MTTVYLAGGINGLSDADATDWREYAKSHLACHTLDPMRRDYRGVEHDDGTAERIVKDDLADIRESDIILVNAPRPSWGTAMEVFYSASIGKNVVTVAPDPLSPWLAYHSTRVFNNLNDALSHINQLLLDRTEAAMSGEVCGC